MSTRNRPDRRSLITVTVMVAGILLVALVGPAIADTVSNQLEQPEVRTLADPPEPAPTPPLTSTDTLDPSPEDEPDGDVTPAPQPPTSSAPTSSAPTSTAPTSTTPMPVAPTTSEQPTPAAEVDADGSVADEAKEDDRRPLEKIQLVPALRDVIVEIGGTQYASDGDGVISIGSIEPGSVFEFIGVRSVPSLRNVAFGRWADGNPNSSRTLDEVDGPVTQIGLVLSHRVTVSTLQSVPDDARLVFESDAGVLRLGVGRTAWVPASRAVDGGDGLVEEELTYRVTGLDDDGDVSEVDPQDFAATPEALWVTDLSA